MVGILPTNGLERKFLNINQKVCILKGPTTRLELGWPGYWWAHMLKPFILGCVHAFISEGLIEDSVVQRARWYGVHSLATEKCVYGCVHVLRFIASFPFLFPFFLPMGAISCSMHMTGAHKNKECHKHAWNSLTLEVSPGFLGKADSSSPWLLDSPLRMHNYRNYKPSLSSEPMHCMGGFGKFSIVGFMTQCTGMGRTVTPGGKGRTQDMQSERKSSWWQKEITWKYEVQVSTPLTLRWLTETRQDSAQSAPCSIAQGSKESRD